MEPALLLIDFPDERSGVRREFDHMHAWGTRAEMETMRRMLDDLFGTRKHQLIDGIVCPHCGAIPPRGTL